MLAQQSLNRTFDLLLAVSPWIAVIAGLLVVLAVVASALRRWWRKDEDPFARQGFTIANLRELRDQGQISPEEYDRAKALVAARALAEGKESEGLSDNTRR